MREVFYEAANELGKEKPVVVATVIRTKGSTPQKPGAKLLVRDDGTGVGTLGGGCVEGDIWFAAKQLLKRGGGAQFQEYELNEDLAAQEGLVCGGTMYFLIDPVYSPEGYLSFAREIDDAYAVMSLDEEDVAGLVAFIELLNDVPDEDFRNLILNATLLDTSGDIA